MHRKLLTEAFEKAKKERGFTQKIHVTRFLSDYIIEDTKKPYGERILRNHYKNAIENREEDVELKSFAAKSLAKYVGYNSYEDYTTKTKGVLPTIHNISFIKKHKLKFIFLSPIIIIIILLSTMTVNNQRWMIWQNDHYVEVKFDPSLYSVSDLKLYKEERINTFKKIKPDCDIIFFKGDGSVNIWYGKNTKKELELFTSLGLHPETGRTLKPITEYMITKYICSDFNKQ
ncbi:hypothetical protein [Lacinutrix chionoecetis]